MSSKRSILNRVLYLNLTIAVVLTLVFLCTSGLYTRQLTRERYNLASTTLTKVNTDFQLEMNRLDSLLTLCLQDSSLVFSISDRLDTSFFLDNAEDAASRLSLIRQSLPYAKLVYLYTHNSDKVVRDNGSLYKGKDFSRIVLDKTVEDISQLPDGLSFFQDSTALYVKNLYSHGYVAVELDLSKFANINKTIGDQFLGYVVQQKDGRCLIENESVPLSEEQLSDALDGGLISVNGTKYYCVSSQMTILPYTGLVLINNDALMLPLHYMYLVMVIAFGVLLASSLLLVVLNYKIYLPLRKFTSQFSDSRENEISIIENEIHDLLSEINTLSQHSKEQIPEKIALHYLLCGGSQLDEGSLKLLEEKYSSREKKIDFHVLSVQIVQEIKGIIRLLKVMLEKENGNWDKVKEQNDEDKAGAGFTGRKIKAYDKLELTDEQQKVLATLRQNCVEETLWSAIAAFQNYPFRTASGLPYQYKLKIGKDGTYNKELLIDRRENSKTLSWSSIKMAFQNCRQISGIVKRPKALGDIRGISYIYPLFWKFGLIEVPEEIAKKMGGE